MVRAVVREAIVDDKLVTGLHPEAIAAFTAGIWPVWELNRINHLISQPTGGAVGAAQSAV